MTDTSDFLLSRRSIVVRNMADPGPTDGDLEKILRAGMRVPDHGRLTPWSGSTAKTDAWQGYAGIPNLDHQVVVVAGHKAHELLPWIHRVFSNLKTWALGVYHGLRGKHLQAYLDEFVFRFNRRRSRASAFQTMLVFATKQKPFTYNMLIKPEPAG